MTAEHSFPEEDATERARQLFVEFLVLQDTGGESDFDSWVSAYGAEQEELRLLWSGWLAAMRFLPREPLPPANLLLPSLESPPAVRNESSMSGEDTVERARQLFTGFLTERDSRPELDFEEWVREHRDEEQELRDLWKGWQAAVQEFPPPLSDEAVAGTGDQPEASLGELPRRLELGSELGRGAFGRVYQAFDPALRRDVALKVLRSEARLQPGARSRFLEEARSLAKVEHPNVVRIHAIAEESGEIHIQLELVKGRTLRELVEEQGPLAPAEAARVGIDLCRALAAIHKADLVHLDVKSGNVMREEGGRIVLLDFGMARSRAALETGGVVGGTPQTMAPEQFRGDPPDARTDLYSVGCVLFWLLTGRFPHEAPTFAELAIEVCQEEPARLVDLRPELPRDIVEVIERALEREPERRFQSAGEMEAALRTALSGAEAPPAPPERPGRRALLTLAAVSAAVFAVALLGWAFLPDPPLEPRIVLYAARGGGDVRLEQGQTVSMGDRLFLEIECEEPIHLYVFNEDEAGNTHTLFPLPTGATNPLPAGQVHRLPSGENGVPLTWNVDEAGGGTEHLVLMAGRHPVPVGELLRREIPAAGFASGPPTTVAQVVEGIDDGTRGFGTVAPLVPGGVIEATSELYLRIVQNVGTDSDVSVELVQFRHPD